MSEVAGRMAVQVGAQYLEAPLGGRGILLGGVPGVAPANVAILGGGVVGHQAAKVAVGLGAHVIIIDRDLERLRNLDDIFSSQIVTLASNLYTIRETVRQADLVIGSVLIPGASAPKLIRRDMIASMRKGSVLVDVAIDQGWSWPTGVLEAACLDNAAICEGLNTYKGHVTYAAVAQSQGRKCRDFRSLL
jgi:alanine dehydrogenase